MKKQDFINNIIDNDSLLEMFENNVMPIQRLMAYYRCAIMEVETKFRVLNEEFSLQHDRNPIETIKTRLKSPESMLRKLKKKSLPLTIEAIEQNLYDIAGIRIICPFIQDINLLADCLLEQDDIYLVEKKDYIQHPKANGYRSLHLIVEIPIFLQNEKRIMKVEVQLRTIAMDFWASLEHQLRYKKNLDQTLAADIAIELEDCARASALLDQRMEAVKNQIEENRHPVIS